MSVQLSYFLKHLCQMLISISNPFLHCELPTNRKLNLFGFIPYIGLTSALSLLKILGSKPLGTTNAFEGLSPPSKNICFI